jgi:NADH-quinone oxidoreductase subunit J
MNPILFAILGILTLGAGLMVIMVRSPINSILFLVMALFSIAGFYVALGAQFIAAIQIIVYAGAIMVLFLFVVMLLNLKQIEEKGRLSLKMLGVISGVILAGLLISVFAGLSALGPATTEMTTTRRLGTVLFTQYLVPFEIASVLLLVAMVGVVVLVKRQKS